MENAIVPLWINKGKSFFSPKTIENLEKHYNSIYIGDFCLRQNKNWTEAAYAVFWNENPKPEHKNYFGLIDTGSSVYICDATSVSEGYWDGIISDNGEVLYSRFRHDFRTSLDTSVCVDGGRDYFKCLGNIHNPRVRISIVRDKLVVNDTLFLPTSKP